MNEPINIEFKPSTKQFQAWQYLTDDHTTFIGYGGSAYSGKSWLLCYYLTTMSIAYPDTAWGLGRKALTNLKRTTLLTLFKVFKECNITQDHYNYNQQLNVITFYNGSQIFLIDTAYQPSDPLYQRFGGYELTGCCIDESAETDLSAINILFTRCGRRNNGTYGLKKKFLETFNPAKNHVYNRYYKPFVEDNLSEHYQFIPALPKDNPSDDVEEYVQGIIDNSDQITIQRLIYGNFEYDDDPNSLIQYDDILDIFNVDPILLEQDNGQMYMTIDVARLGKDKSVIMVWKGLTVIETVVIPKSTLDVLEDKIRDLIKKYQVRLTNVIADADGVGGSVPDHIKCKSFVNNSVALYKQNYQNLKTQCYYKLAGLINEHKMKINDETYKTDIISELEQVKSFNVDSDGKLQILPKDKVKKFLGRSPDFSDTLMMRAFFEVRAKKANYCII